MVWQKEAKAQHLHTMQLAEVGHMENHLLQAIDSEVD